MNCTPHPYTLEPFHYTKKKGKTLDQKKFFIDMVKAHMEKSKTEYPSWFLNEFVSTDPEKPISYWNVVPDNQKKTRYFMLPKKKKDSWSMGHRLSDAKTFNAKDPRWKTKTEKTYYTPTRMKDGQMAPGIEYGKFKNVNN